MVIYDSKVTNRAKQTELHIVIAGGGFAGVRTALQLCRNDNFRVTLITPEDSFAFYPQFYHAATGGMRTEAALALSQILRGCDVEIVQDRVSQLDADNHTIITASGKHIRYDKLVLALGSVGNYFGIPGLDHYSFGVKSIAEAERFKQHLHQTLVEEGRPDLNYVIVGGGPTGIELAGSLGRYLDRILELHDIRARTYRIELVEAAPRLLPRSPESYAKHVTKRLQRLGVKVMTGIAVKSESAEGLKLGDQELKSKTVVWTAGTANHPFFRDNAASFTLAKNGRIEVNEFMEGRPNVYVIGDNAASQYGGLAETAINDANFVARDLILQQRHRPRKSYRPKTPSSVIPVGEHWAAFQYKSLMFYSWPGWVMRRAADLIGYMDLLPVGAAVGVWLRDRKHEDNCPTCEPTGKKGRQ